MTTYTWAEKFGSFERINSIRETNGNFDLCNSCKRLGTSRLHELHESKFPFVSRIEFIRSKLSNFSAHVYVVNVWALWAGLVGLSCGNSVLQDLLWEWLTTPAPLPRGVPGGYGTGANCRQPPPDPGHRAAAAPAGASVLFAPAVPGMSPFRLPSAAAGGGETARRVSFEWDATAGQSVAA